MCCRDKGTLLEAARFFARHHTAGERARGAHAELVAIRVVPARIGHLRHAPLRVEAVTARDRVHAGRARRVRDGDGRALARAIGCRFVLRACRTFFEGI